jgi:hypothetical protein
MPNFLSDLSLLIENDLKMNRIEQKSKKNKLKKSNKKVKKVRFQSFSSDITYIASHSNDNDNFIKIALDLGWNYCKKCNTLVANVDSEGFCNPPCIISNDK